MCTQDAWACYRSAKDSASFETLPLSFTDDGHWHHLVLTTKGYGKGMDMYIDGKLEATHPRGHGCEKEVTGCVGLDKGNSDPSIYRNAFGIGGEPIDPAGDMRLCGRQIGGAITNDLGHTGDEEAAEYDHRRYFRGQVGHFAVWDAPLSQNQVTSLLAEYRKMYLLPDDASDGDKPSEVCNASAWSEAARAAGWTPPCSPEKNKRRLKEPPFANRKMMKRN